jgi:antitoxin HicB
METKKPGGAADFLTLDDFLAEEGTLETFQAVAIKEVLAYQIEQAMKAQKLTRRGAGPGRPSRVKKEA